MGRVVGMATDIEIYQDSAQPPEWRWRVAVDGDVIGKSSEGFSRRDYAANNLRTLPRYCRSIDIKAASENPGTGSERHLPLSFYEDEAAKWRWRVKARNGLIVHASDQGWDTKEEAVENVESLVAVVSGWAQD